MNSEGQEQSATPRLYHALLSAGLHGPLRVLIVEDDIADEEMLREFLDKVPGVFTIDHARDLDQALERIRNSTFDAILLDLLLPGSHGWETFSRVFGVAPQVPIIVLSGMDDIDLSLRCLHGGAQDYHVKGSLTANQLVRSIAYAIERKRTEEQLKAERNLLRNLIEAVPDNIYVKDRAGRYVMDNAAHRRFLGFEREEELLGHTVFAVFPAETATRLHADELACMEERKPMVNRLETMPNAHGQARSMLTTRVPLEDTRGDITGFVGISRDITERKQIEDALWASEHRFRTLAMQAPVGIIETDAEGDCIFSNEKWCHLSGLSNEASLKTGWLNVVHPDDRFWLISQWGKTRAGEFSCECRLLQADTTALKWVKVRSVSVQGQGNESVGYLWIVSDLTAQRLLEKQIVEASEWQQRRIGHDLHDDLCQQLTATTFASGMLAQRLTAKGLPEESAWARELGEVLRTATSHVREVARGLCPVDLGTGGLMNALRALTESTGRLSAIPCAFECPEPVLIRDHTVAINLYRICQEALNNALKHSEPKSVTICLNRADEKIALVVRDDGKGFEYPPPSGEGMGLHSMMYRARMMAAWLDVSSAPSKGTSVTCTVRDEGTHQHDSR